jgi:urea transporter
MPRGQSNFLVQSLRGTSQVFFMENALTGVLFFAAMAYASAVSGVWATTIGAAIGVGVATLTARLLECDEPSVSSGLYGFNGVLVVLRFRPSSPPHRNCGPRSSSARQRARSSPPPSARL